MKRNLSSIYFKKSTSDKRMKTNSESDNGENNDILKNLLFNEDDKIYMNDNHVYFYDDVSQDTVDKVKKLMRKYYNKTMELMGICTIIKVVPKPLFLHIFSPGGEVYAGLSLYDFIIEYKKVIEVHTIVEGMVASAATFFSIAGTKRYVAPNAYMLIHQLSTMLGGNYEQIKDEFNNNEKIMEKITTIYTLHTKINRKKLSEILKHDINWDAEECLRNGLVDEIKLIDTFNDI